MNSTDCAERPIGAGSVDSTAVPLVVQKFGGTSVADPERIREVADHVARTKRRGDDVVVVVQHRADLVE